MLYDYILKAKVRSIFIIYQEKKDNKLDSYSEFNFLFFYCWVLFYFDSKMNFHIHEHNCTVIRRSEHK